MEFREGDILLVTKYGSRVIPVTPEGECYSSELIDLDEDHNPYHKDEGDVFLLQITNISGSDVKGEWYTDEYPAHEDVHYEWIETLIDRGVLERDVHGNVPDDFDPEETEATTESQEKRGLTETNERDTWTETKSDMMSNLDNI
jgi:hypothetical protein